MIFLDKNQTLLPPEGYQFTHLEANGSFLRVEYRRIDSESVSVVNIFLNDMGREVCRAVEDVDLYSDAFPEPNIITPKHLTWWSRFKLWFSLLIYEGREILKWRN